MAARHYTSAKKSFATTFATAGFATLLVVVCLWLFFTCAGSLVGAASASGFSSQSDVSQLQSTFVSDASFDEPSESLVLESSAKRDMSKGVEEIAAEEEAARIAAEEQARIDEQERIAAAEEAKIEATINGAPALSDVDFSCGREAFIAEWTARIDAYLAGTPLAGYGSVFAEAAWNNSVDPRWSPAISHTESTNGLHCFLPYNAWGWTNGSWSSWEEAINAHVAGLAQGYGYTITLANAMKYCPPNYANWYANTVNEMAKI